MADDLRALYDELGRPTAAKFSRALRRRGIKATDEDLEFVAPPPVYRGKIFSLGLDQKWAADVMTLPPGRHALVVQDVFSRFLWVRRMSNQGDVVAPMRDIMRVRRPRVLYTDADTAFRSQAFRDAMRDLGVEFRVKLARNDIATVDSAIKYLGETIVRYTTSSGEGD